MRTPLPADLSGLQATCGPRRARQGLGTEQLNEDVSPRLPTGDNHKVQHRTNGGAPTMPRILRVNPAGPGTIGTADSAEVLRRIVDGLSPGRYHVGQMGSDPLPGGHTSRR